MFGFKKKEVVPVQQEQENEIAFAHESPLKPCQMDSDFFMDLWDILHKDGGFLRGGKSFLGIVLQLIETRAEGTFFFRGKTAKVGIFSQSGDAPFFAQILDAHLFDSFRGRRSREIRSELFFDRLHF